MQASIKLYEMIGFPKRKMQFIFVAVQKATPSKIIKAPSKTHKMSNERCIKKMEQRANCRFLITN